MAESCPFEAGLQAPLKAFAPWQSMVVVPIVPSAEHVFIPHQADVSHTT
jgi:hypothetical protein